MSKYNVNEEYDLENRREVTLTGFSSNALDDVLRATGNNNEPALNGNSGGVIGGAHAITKDAKIVNLEGESLLSLFFFLLLRTFYAGRTRDHDRTIKGNVSSYIVFFFFYDCAIFRASCPSLRYCTVRSRGRFLEVLIATRDLLVR